MTQFKLIRERFLANARQHLLTSGTTTEQPRSTCAHQHPPTPIIMVKAPFMGIAA